MVTNNTKVVCPKCRSINAYSIIKNVAYDNDMHITYSCDVCNTNYTNVYTLVYMYGYTDTYKYDRDNIISC